MATPILRKPHDPAKLKGKKAEKIKKDILDGIKAGLPLGESFKYAGLSRFTYQKWRNWWLEDLEEGYKDTNLINFMNEIMRADSGLKKRISEAMLEKAIDEKDTRMLMYLADNRIGYANMRRNQVELASGSNNVQINIIDMKSVEAIDDNSDDYEEIEVNGVSRDDSDPTEMD